MAWTSRSLFDSSVLQMLQSLCIVMEPDPFGSASICHIRIRTESLPIRIRMDFIQMWSLTIGTSVADPWHFGVGPDPRIHVWLRDPDPDPAIFVIDLQDANKKLFFTSFFDYYFLKVRYTYIIFQW